MTLGGFEVGDRDPARIGANAYPTVLRLQKEVSTFDDSYIPVICAMHGYCIGAGMDLSSCADIRICTKDTQFTVKEIDIGICADIGVIQRFQKVIGNNSFFRECAYTGRFFSAEEALQVGYVSYVTENKEACFEKAMQLAKEIASKSPVGIYTMKKNINFSRDHNVKEGLEHIAMLNMASLQTKDVEKAVMGNLSKQKAEFPKL